MTFEEHTTLDALAVTVSKGFEDVNRRLQTLERRTEWLDGNIDVSRLEEQKLHAEIEGLPIARHEERIKRLERKVSDEVKAVNAEHVTGKIELARMEAVMEATGRIRDEMREERLEAIKAAQAAASTRWKRISMILTSLVGLAAAAIAAFATKGCIG